MTEHPLTDDICQQIAGIEDRELTSIEMDNMRAAADWQLESLKDAWQDTLIEECECGIKFHSQNRAANIKRNYPDIWNFDEVLTAMRPTTQEDN